MQAYDVTFRDKLTDLAYVMVTNEGAGRDTGAYCHVYDDLTLAPKPATLSLLTLGDLAILRRRKR